MRIKIEYLVFIVNKELTGWMKAFDMCHDRKFFGHFETLEAKYDKVPTEDTIKTTMQAIYHWTGEAYVKCLTVEVPELLNSDVMELSDGNEIAYVRRKREVLKND